MSNLRRMWGSFCL
uniref:Uncharacterized protein n=1 Tax=Arundo donax TaxID=35708 RepID=A0A0A8Y2G4_ARUDO